MRFSYPAVARLVERRLNRPLQDSEVSAYFARQAVDFIRQHPWKFLRPLGRKTLLFWGPYELGHNKEDHYEREFSPVLSRLPGSFAGVVGLFAMGVYVLRRARTAAEVSVAASPPERPVVNLILLYIGALFASYLPFFVSGRYRVPLIPFLLVIGAAGVSRLADLVRGRQRGPAIRAGLIGLGVWGLAGINFAGYQPSLAKWYYEQSLALERAGRTEEAQAAYRKAEAHDPAFFHSLYHNLGVGLAHEGRYEEAVQRLTAALRYRPEAADTLNSLGAVLTVMGRPAEAQPYLVEALRLQPDNIEVRFNLAIALANQGQFDAAVGHLAELVRLRPGDTRSQAQLAMTLSQAGRLQEAADHLLEILRRNPDDAFAHNNLGVILSGLGRDDEGLMHLREAARLAPELADAWLNMGMLLAKRGQWADALDALRRRLVLVAGDPRALFYTGQATARLGNLDEALSFFRGALGPSSTNTEWLIEASLSLATRPEAREQHFAAALDWADRAMFLLPDPPPDAFNALSAALARAGRFKEAATWAEDGARAADQAGQPEIARVLRERAGQYRRGEAWTLAPDRQGRVSRQKRIRLRRNPGHDSRHIAMAIRLWRKAGSTKAGPDSSRP